MMTFRRAFFESQENKVCLSSSLELFTLESHGTHKCCRCNTPLNGITHHIGLDIDEAGHNWRGFCNKCSEDLNLIDNHELAIDEEKLFELYDNYLPSSTID